MTDRALTPKAASMMPAPQGPRTREQIAHNRQQMRKNVEGEKSCRASETRRALPLHRKRPTRAKPGRLQSGAQPVELSAPQERYARQNTELSKWMILAVRD